MSTKKIIAITGATGFLGQHLLEDFDLSGYTLRIITRNASKKPTTTPPGSEIVEADLTHYDSLKKAFKDVDSIVNIAAEVRDQQQFEETNVRGTQNLTDAAIENNVSKIIHTSSVGVVGRQYSHLPIMVNETTTCFPKNEYERTKLASEKILIEARKKNDFLLTILRPTNVFGERHPFNALLNLMNTIHSKKKIITTRSSMVNYLYVKDLTKLIVQLIADEKEHGIVNVGEAKKLQLFATAIASQLGGNVKIFQAPQSLINLAEMVGIKKLRAISNCVVYDDAKLKTFYRYPFGVENGLKRTIEFYKNQQLIQ